MAKTMWYYNTTMEKKEKIKQKIKETKERRKQQVPTIIQCKLQNLSKAKLSLLERLFLEAKWLYNWLIANTERLKLSTKDINVVEVKVKDKFEERQLTKLGSQLKQGLQDRVKQALKGLKALKNNGQNIGALKFKSRLNSIPLKQYKITYTVDKKHNKVRIQGLGSFRVLGLHQIDDSYEIANATLIKKADGYYINITCYKQKDTQTEIEKPLAIDFGIEIKLTLSNGLKIDFEIPESKRLKKLQQILSRKVKGSKNYNKIKELIQREYLNMQRVRKEIHNKLIALTKRYKHIVFQDDRVKSWHEGWFGREVQYSGIGGITQRLKNNLSTPISVIERFQTTSKTCNSCKTKLNISLSDRQIACPVCGYTEDRDINATKNMLSIVFGKVEEEWTKLTDKEKELIDRLFENIKKYMRINYTSGIRGKVCPTVGLTGS